MAAQIKMDDTNILYLHSTEQVPFGKLSPLYRQKLKIDQEEASNIISYCYAGLLKKGGIRNGILLENGTEARTEALKYFREEKDQLYNESMYNGLLEKIKQNPQAKQALLDSGESIIVYQSENVFLGVNAAGNGQNRIGSMLMKIRTIIQKQIKEENRRRFLELAQLGRYNIYIVYKSLSDRILKGIDDLSNYVGKMPEQIIEMLRLPPFPGKFDINVSELSYFFLHPTTIAEVLRNQYADEYNEQLVNLKKREILNEFLIKNALKDLPSNNKELYNRYKQLKVSQVFNEEYETLSKTFRPIVSEMNSFIENLGDRVSDLEDRLYFLASQNMLEGINANIDKPFIKLSDEFIESQKQYRNQELKKLLELLKQYKKEEDVDSEKQKKDIQEKIEKQKKAFKEAEEKFYKLEKSYMKAAAKIAEDEYYRKKGIEFGSDSDDSESESDSDSESESDSDEEISEKLERLRSKYKQNYKKMYKELLEAKRYLKNRDETQRLLEEYNKSIPKRPFVWKRPSGKTQYELTPSDEVMLDEAFNEIVPIIRHDKQKISLTDLKNVKGKQRVPVKRRDIEDIRGIPPKYPNLDMYEKQYLFEVLLNNASMQENLRDLPVLVDSFISSSSSSSSNIYRFSDYDPLSPSFVDFLEINNFIFPNVYYYIYFKLLASISPTQDQIMFTTHNLLLVDPSLNSLDLINFKPVNQIIELYNNFEGLYISDKLTKRAQKALYEKFRYSSSSTKDNLSKVCKLLIATYPKQLVYDEKDDLILGFVRGNGLNMIGRIMEDIRNELLVKYGEMRISDLIEDEPQKIRERRHLSEFAKEKTNELLYVLSIYVDYIKNKTHINDEDVSFVIDTIYKNCHSKLKKILENLKIQPVTVLFEKHCNKFLKSANYSISKSSIEKLWSHIYILNELYNFEIANNHIDLFNFEKVGSFGVKVDLADVNWFVSSVKNLQDDFGNIDISLGVNYEVDGKMRSKRINRKNIYEFKDKDLEDYYNDTIMKLLSLLNSDSIKEVFVSIYETPISLIRKRYVKQKEKICRVDTQIERTEKEKNLDCVIETFITILNKLKNHRIISENITDSTLLFINRLLSISGSIRKGISFENMTTYESKEEKEDELYQLSLSQLVKNIFSEKGFNIVNIDHCMIALKNLAYNPNYNDVMARVLSFLDIQLEEQMSFEELKGLFDMDRKDKEKLYKKRHNEEEEEEEEEENEEEEEDKGKKKKSKVERKKKSKDEDEEEESEGEEGYDIDIADINSEAEDQDSEEDEDLLDEGDEDHDEDE